MLGGLGLKFLGRSDIRKEGHVDVKDVVTADILAHLADGFQEGLAFNVADGAADLNEQDVSLRI